MDTHNIKSTLCRLISERRRLSMHPMHEASGKKEWGRFRTTWSDALLTIQVIKEIYEDMFLSPLCNLSIRL